MAKDQAVVMFHYCPGLMGDDSNLEELNQMLKQGWRIAQISPTSGTDDRTSYALVVLEREAAQ